MATRSLPNRSQTGWNQSDFENSRSQKSNANFAETLFSTHRWRFLAILLPHPERELRRA